MSGEVKLSDVPSVDEVVASLAERGITSFDGGESETVEALQPEPQAEEAVQEEAVEADHAVEGSGEQSEGLPEAEHTTETVGSEDVSDEPVPVERPSSSQYVDFLERQAEIDARERDLGGRKVEAESRVKSLQEELEALKGSPKPQSPMDALRAAGYTYEEATSQILGGWEEPKVDPVDEKVGAVQAELEKTQALVQQLTQKLQERDQADLQARAAAAKEGIIGTIKEVTAESQFDYISSVGDAAYEAVNSLMLEYHQQYGTVLDIADACAIIEKQYEQMFGGIFKSEKLQKAHGLGKVAINEQAQTAAKPVKRKTLTNKSTVSAPARNQVDVMSNLEAQDEITKMLVFKD